MVKTTDNHEKTGLPKLSSTAHTINKVSGTAIMIGAPSFQAWVGYGIAQRLYKEGETDFYDEKIKLVREYDLHLACLAIIVFGITNTFLAYYPFFHKEVLNHFRLENLNFRTNSFIYKLATKKEGEGSAVILYEDGDLGRYNRANRSIYNFLENSLPIIAATPLAFFMFPHPAFQCVCAYAFGRFIYQIGYTYGGFLFHLPGFFLDRFATFTMLSLLSIAYFQ